MNGNLQQDNEKPKPDSTDQEALSKELDDELEKTNDLLKKAGRPEGDEAPSEEQGDESEESIEEEEAGEEFIQDDIAPEDLGEHQNLEKHVRQPFGRQEIAAMITAGEPLDTIWEQARARGEFTKFDGSSYYVSEKLSKGITNNWWRRRSAAGNSSGDGYLEDKMFDNLIKKELKKYRILLDLYDDIDEVATVVDYLRDQGQNKGLYNKLKNLAPEKDDLKSEEASDSALADMIEAGEETSESTKSDSGDSDTKAVGKKAAEADQGKVSPAADSSAAGEVIDNEAESGETDPEKLKVGNWGQWVSQGVEQFETPREIEKIEEKDGQRFVKFKGEKTSVPETEVEEREKPDQESAETGDEEKAVGDSVYYMEKELRRWRDPKKIRRIEFIGQGDDREGYAGFEDEDGLYPLAKLRPAADLDSSEADYQPGPGEAAPTPEQAADVPNAEDLAGTADEDLEKVGINERIAEQFSSHYNISREELASVEGFRELTEGQQQLVFENFNQLTLNRAQEDGLEAYEEDLEESSLLKGFWKKTFSNYYKANSEAVMGERLMNEGISLHRDALADIVKNTAESGVDLDEDGQLLFAQESAEMSAVDKETTARFNRLAQEFASTSSNWRYDDWFSEHSFSGANRTEFQEKRAAYQEALKEYIEVARKHGGVEGAKQAMAADQRVRYTQFFSTDRDYEQMVQQVKDEPKTWRAFNSKYFEPAGYMFLGGVGRSLAGGMIGVFGAPLVAAPIGAYRARGRAKTDLEEEVMKRRGGKDTELVRKAGKFGDKTRNEVAVINTVSAEKLTGKLQRLVDALNDPELSEVERSKKTDELHRRVQYTRAKLEGGTWEDRDKEGNLIKEEEYAGDLIDYGDVSTRTSTKYALLQTLGEAQAIEALESDPDLKDDVIGRMDRYLNYKDKKTREYVHKKTLKGAGLAAGFAFLGGEIRDWWVGDDAGGIDLSESEADIDGGGEAAPEPDYSGDEDIITSDSPSVSAPENPAGVGEAAASALGEQSFAIDESGEGMIHAIADKFEGEYNLSHEKAMEIGNQLFLKGEALKGDDELFNLVGKGGSFTLDFGDLTAADLESQSAAELVETLDFDQGDFVPGDSGVEPAEELPASAERVVQSDFSTDIERVEPDFAPEQTNVTGASASNYMENPVERVPASEITAPELGPSIEELKNDMSPEELQEWEQKMEDAGIEVKDSPASSEASSAAENRFFQARVNEVSSNDLRSKVALLSARTAAGDFSELPSETLEELESFLRSHADSSTIDNVTRLRQEDPELLTVFERVLAADDNNGVPLSSSEKALHALTRQEVSQLSERDFSGQIPDYSFHSLKASQGKLAA